jgi:hypothetical protein
MRINRDQAQQAAGLIAAGTSVREIAEGWEVSTSALYSAMRRHGIQVERPVITAKEHVALQQASNTPPELYAHRAGLTLNTLRKYAWECGAALAMNTYAERKAFWEEKFDTFNPFNARAFCVLNDLPVTMVAHWYHKLNNPSQLLLWGFANLMTVPGDQFADVTRYNDPAATLFALGKGKTVVPIGIRLANEVYMAANPL